MKENGMGADGTALADLRRRAGMTQKHVAQRMGVSRPRVSQIERDYPNVQFALVQRYIDALGGWIAFMAASSPSVHASDITADHRPSRDRGDRTKLREAVG